ncbi:MAG: AMIN domain-containing protein, partial [Thermoanaerobaculia bacterium]
MSKPRRILLVASVLLVCVGSADAGLWSFRRDAKTAEPVTAAAAPLTLSAIEVDGSRIILRTTGAPAYTSYSPSPGVFVVDLTGTARDAAMAIPATLPAAVSTLVAEEVVEMGNRLTRVTFRLSAPASLEVASAENSLVVKTPAVAVAEANPLVEAIAPAAVPVETPRVEPLEEPAVAVAEPSAIAEDIQLPKAKTIRRVETNAAGDGVEIVIAGDGKLAYKAFALESPARVVIDIEGRNAVARSKMAVDDDAVKGVRVGQFSPSVARVVVDLAQKTAYDIVADGDRLRVSFGGSGARTVAAVPPPAPVQKQAAAVPLRADPPPTPAKSVEEIPVRAAAADASSWSMPDSASKGARQVINSPAPQ